MSDKEKRGVRSFKNCQTGGHLNAPMEIGRGTGGVGGSPGEKKVNGIRRE